MPSVESLVLACILLLSAIDRSTGQMLEAVYSNVRLPFVDNCPSPFYDGNDKIYLFGGETPEEILVYSLSSDTIEVVGRITGNGFCGVVHADTFGNIFSVGVGPFSKDVYKFDLVNKTSTVVATLPVRVESSISHKYNDSSNIVYILEGSLQINISTFDLETLTYTTVATLPFNVNAKASVRVGNKAYIFHGSGNKSALELDLDTFEMKAVGPATLPLQRSFPSSVSSVYDGTFAYMIGGYTSDTGYGIIQFNPSTFENTYISVNNLLVDGQNTYFDHAPGCVFVPSSNRIYCFGGASYAESGKWNRYDEIFYIDLTPLGANPPTTTQTPPTTTQNIQTTTQNSLTTTQNPATTTQPTPTSTQHPQTTTQNPPTTTAGPPISSTTSNPEFFNCINRTDGFYPHPTDGIMFIRCLDEVMTVLTCPPPLLFNPKKASCNFPDQVRCADNSDANYYYILIILCLSICLCCLAISSLVKCRLTSRRELVEFK